MVWLCARYTLASSILAHFLHALCLSRRRPHVASRRAARWQAIHHSRDLPIWRIDPRLERLVVSERSGRIRGRGTDGMRIRFVLRYRVGLLMLERRGRQALTARPPACTVRLRACLDGHFGLSPGDSMPNFADLVHIVHPVWRLGVLGLNIQIQVPPQARRSEGSFAKRASARLVRAWPIIVVFIIVEFQVFYALLAVHYFTFSIRDPQQRLLSTHSRTLLWK